MPNHIAKHLLKSVAKNGDDALKNGAKNGAKHSHRAKPKPGKTLPKPKKGDVEGNFQARVETLQAQDRGELKPRFRDESGQEHWIQKNGVDPETGELKFQYRNRNDKLNEVDGRARNADAQTNPEAAPFREGMTETKGIDAHHIAGLEQFSWLFEGLDEADQSAMIGLLEKSGIFTGHNAGNRADLPKKVHDKLHTWMKKKGFTGKNKASIAHLPLEKRLPFVEQMKDEYDQSMEHMYGLMMSDNEFHTSYVKEAEPEFAGIAPGSS